MNITKNKAEANVYSHVFNYTDHLGNIRLSYTLVPNLNDLGFRTAILEENHYYPFGLKHKGYNSYQYVFVPLNEIDGYDLGIDSLPERGRDEYQYKFQGQERQDELGLNWDSFKWRNYDYAIGRFFNIDPLTEEYNTWSPYVFSGNRVIDARELEGLEPKILYDTHAEAENNFADQYNGLSIRMKAEIGAQKYKVSTPDGYKYSYTIPTAGGEGLVDTSASGPIPKEGEFVGDIHTHEADRNLNVLEKGKVIDNTDNKPSSVDVEQNSVKNSKIPTYEHDTVITPNGSKFNYGPKDTDTKNLKPTKVGRQLPSDPNSTTKRGTVSPNTTPTVLPNNVEIDNYPKIPEPKK